MKVIGALTLSTYRRPMLELDCRKCGRAGRYRREGLVDRHGPDMTSPDHFRILANCPKHGSASDPCAAVYVGLK